MRGRSALRLFCLSIVGVVGDNEVFMLEGCLTRPLMLLELGEVPSDEA